MAFFDESGYPLGAIVMATDAQCDRPAPRFTNNVEDVPNLTIMSPKLYRALKTSNLLPEHVRVGGNA